MGYGAANVLKCKKHGLLYVEECSACLQDQRDALSVTVMRLEAEVKADGEQMIAHLERIDALADRLHRIGNIAHDRSTGPEIPDHYWEIRHLAFELL